MIRHYVCKLQPSYCCFTAPSIGTSGWRCSFDNLFYTFLDYSTILYMRMRSVASNQSDLSKSWFDRSILLLIISSFYILLLSTTCCSLFWCKAVAAVSRHSAQQRAQKMLTELVNQSPPMLRMLPQQHGHLHPIDLRLVSSTRDPNNSASSTRVQVPEEISTLVPTNPLGEVQSSHWSDWR